MSTGDKGGSMEDDCRIVEDDGVHEAPKEDKKDGADASGSFIWRPEYGKGLLPVWPHG